MLPARASPVDAGAADRLAEVFNVQGSEIIIILLVALIVLGPEKLPDAIRRFTKLYAEVRKMSTGFQSELRNALDEPMRELRDTADLVRKNADLRQLLDDSTASTPSSTPATTAPAPGLDPVNAAEQAAAAQVETTETVDDLPAAGEPDPEPAPTGDAEEGPSA